MTPIIPPQAINYAGSVLPFTSNAQTAPLEGNKEVPISIKWSTDGGANRSVFIDCGQGAPRGLVNVSQIVTIYVNNLLNINSVNIYFDDTQYLLEVPPLAYGYFPVITNVTRFTIWSTGAGANDRTYLNVLNYFMPPVVVSEFAFADIPSGTISTNLVLQLGSQNIFTQNLIPAGTEGVIQAIQIDVTDLVLTNRITGLPLVGNSVAGLSLTDAPGVGSTIFWITGLGGTGYYAHLNLAMLSGLAIDMTNGLSINVNATNSFMYGFVSTNIYWRLPS